MVLLLHRVCTLLVTSLRRSLIMCRTVPHTGRRMRRHTAAHIRRCMLMLSMFAWPTRTLSKRGILGRKSSNVPMRSRRPHLLADALLRPWSLQGRRLRLPLTLLQLLLMLPVLLPLLLLILLLPLLLPLPLLLLLLVPRTPSEGLLRLLLLNRLPRGLLGRHCLLQLCRRSGMLYAWPR